MADRWCPPALGLPREVLNSNRMLELPMDEVVFQGLRHDIEFDNDARTGGLWKDKITLVEIFGPIQDLNISLLSSNHETVLIDQQLERLEARLNQWLEQLPRNRRMNNENLDLHRTAGEGGTFVALHLGYHHYSTLLYFQYLDASPSQTVNRHDLAQKCRSHALQFSQLLHQARSTNDCHVVYLTVAHMTMVSSSVLLHMLLFGDEAEIEIARVHLVYNFEALVELGRYWPHVGHIIERLLTFQNACLRSGHTHRIDKWMVRFLLEHALPFAEKVTEEDDGMEVLEVQGQSSGAMEQLSSRADILNLIFTQWYDTDSWNGATAG